MTIWLQDRERIQEFHKFTELKNIKIIHETDKFLKLQIQTLFPFLFIQVKSRKQKKNAETQHWWSVLTYKTNLQN